MKSIRGAGLVFIAVLPVLLRAQEVRRAQPPDEPPTARAVPFKEPTPTPRPRGSSSPTSATAEAPHSDATPEPETDDPDRRQLDYANALFSRKLFDLAAPEYEKYIAQFPNGAGRASAYFYLGQSYRALNRAPAARTSFQGVLDHDGDSEFAGPAAYGIAELLFTQKDYAGALPLFHRSAAKSKEPSLGLSARYFEARCLENVDRKDEAANLYLQVIEAKNSNPFRDDARSATGSIFLLRGRKAEAFRQYEALSNETQNAGLKAEATVRAGLLAMDLQQGEKGKIDRGMTEKAMALLQKGRALPQAGKWRGIAEVGLLRLQYQSGQYAQVLAEYKRAQAEIPDDVRAEMMLLAANSERQLNHTDDADKMYREVIAKYPDREEAKDAQYQRLINFYNASSPALVDAVDEFLKANPTGERSDQAKLLKAEAFYKEQKFAEAAPLYSALRASQLSPKLRGEAAYKLGWCFVQTKDVPNIIGAFSYLLKAFPDSGQAAAALTQRALAYQSNKNFDAAIADLNSLLANYPGAREREAALQQKALILGQQENGKGMADAFAQLLKEFPKSSVAAQAHYYIGKASFEAKQYKSAVTDLDAARKLNKDQYGNLATLRIISAFFYLKDRAALAKEVDAFTTGSAGAKVPAEILEWLGIEFYNDKNFGAAERYLSALSRIENANVKPELWFYLGDTETKLNKFSEAETAYEKFLSSGTDPASKAKALIALGSTKIATHKPDDAQKIAEEIMRLQPEGRVNAEARLLAGDVQMERQRFEDAGKAFMSVALLYDDPAITPRALQKAATAYEKAGRKEEAERAAKQLHDRYPGYAGG